MTVIHKGTATAAQRSHMQRLWEDGQAQRQKRITARETPPLIRLWDGDWNYIGTVGDALEGSFQWRLNDTGSGYLQLPVHSWIVRKILAYRQRDSRNIHVTMDKDGTRWSGRMKNALISKKNDGTRVVDLNFLHDYEEVKHIHVWPNPFLPAEIQFPRTFMLLGPTKWTLKMALFLNIWRLAGDAWNLPDDPLDPNQWLNEFIPSKWPLQVAPSQKILSDSTPWTLINSRMKSWHNMAAPKLADAQLMVTTRRYLKQEDDEPWPGANLRNGALIFDIEDKSGYWSTRGTAQHGDLWKGLVRTVQEVINDFDEQTTIIDEPVRVPKYEWHNFLSTEPDAPYVVYRDGPITGVQASDFTWEPATDVHMLAGGSSSYGVNEAISVAVKLIGNYLGGVFSFALQAGDIADEFLAPIYADTLFAWHEKKKTSRARELGWSHYYEHFVEGADKGYTLSSVMALRQGFWETREKLSHRLEIADGAPWFVGENGKGHFFLGDRVGATIEGLPDGLIVVEQVTDLTYKFSRTNLGWEIVCGDMASQRSPMESVLDRVRDALGSIHDLGVI